MAFLASSWVARSATRNPSNEARRSQVSPYGLKVRSALMMAGTLDRQDLLQASARVFSAAGRRARYQALPEARHGAMGKNPEQSMDQALSWSMSSQRMLAVTAALPHEAQCCVV